MLDELRVSKNFINENKSNLDQFRPKSHKPGPYTKQDKENRRNEVYRLHFDYGYSARKIADSIKVNRHTVDNDIDYWYTRIVANNNIFDPEISILITLERFEKQRTRLREMMDKVDSFQEHMTLENMIFEIDSKITQVYQKMSESVKRIMNLEIHKMNTWMKQNNKPERFITLFDTLSISEKAKEKIDKIIIEDRKNKRI